MIEKKSLIAGDVLLYGRTPFKESAIGWFFGLIINIKTWSKYCHVEVYNGAGTSLASRDGVGVGCYPLRLAQIEKVRRPSALDYDHRAAVRWFRKVEGQPYDFVGLLSFGLNKTKLAIQRLCKIKPSDMQFCSEFATRLYRRAGLDPFNPEFDADKVSPAQFDQSPVFRTVWKRR